MLLALALIAGCAASDPRVLQGEYEHMIFYVLQSTQFTRVPRIEPALSAKEYAEDGRIPKPALDRMGDFLRAVRRPAGNPRLAYFRTLRPTHDLLRREYARAMPPLYRKEFQGGADFYRERGLSTDTSIEACYAVHVGLGVLKELRPGARINRVLIVGPGLDLAPRTGLNDAYPPQSLEPFAVADSLLALGLADSARLAIDCVDINPRVVAWFRTVPSGIHLYLSGAGYTPEFEAWYAAFGAHIGTRKGGEIRLRPLHLSATCLDIIAARRDARYDLIVATNVFPYFDDAQLARALAHLKAMLAPFGYLIHNEPRPALESVARNAGMPPVQARSVLVRQAGSRKLYDTVVVHEIGSF